jgi:hypothetical protein
MTRPRPGPAVAAPAALLTACLLSACGAGDSPSAGAPVTVTVTPTVTVTLPSTPSSPSTSPGSSPAADVHSDVVGRSYDLGTIVDVTSSSGTPVIVLDRWTVTGTPDGEVAAHGVPIRVHTDAPYENQNTRTTFRVPVAPEATFTYHHCVSVDQPMQSRSVTLKQLAALDRSEGVILLRLDDRGRATRVDNDPAC